MGSAAKTLPCKTVAAETTGVESSGGGGSPAGTRPVVLLAAFCTSLVSLNSVLIALALPEIGQDLDVSLAATSWLVTVYVVTNMSVQALAGRAGDLVGRIRSLRVGLVVFAVTSIVAAVAESLALLLVCRTVQAAFGALLFSNGLALVRSLPEERRARQISAVTAAFSAAPTLGMLLGGFLLEAGGWETLFLVNLPLVVVALGLSRAEAQPQPPAPREERFDRLGALLLFLLATGVALVLALSDRLPAWALAAGVAAVLAVGAAWLRVELRHPDPVLQPRFFASGRFSISTSGIALSAFSWYAVLLTVPVLDVGGADDRVAAGAMLAAFGAAATVMAALTGRVVARWGARVPVVVAFALLALAQLGMGLDAADRGIGVVTACMLVGGAGCGLSGTALYTIGLEAIEERDAGVASGVLYSGRYFGTIAAASLFAAIVGDVVADAGPEVQPLLLAAAGAAVFGAALALLLPAHLAHEHRLGRR